MFAEAIAAVIWLLMLQPDGFVDQAFQAAGLRGLVQLWLADLEVGIYTMFVVVTWKYIGLGIILFLAGLRGVRVSSRRRRRPTAPTPGSGPLHDYPAARADDPDLGLPRDHRLDAALRPDLDHDRGRAWNASNTMATYMIDHGFRRMSSATAAPSP